ncbi:hypothetical protein D3C84_851420 [compost metagenome]
MGHATGLDVGHAFGRSIVDEFGRRLGPGTVGTQAHQHDETGGAKKAGHTAHGRGALLYESSGGLSTVESEPAMNSARRPTRLPANFGFRGASIDGRDGGSPTSAT